MRRVIQFRTAFVFLAIMMIAFVGWGCTTNLSVSDHDQFNRPVESATTFGVSDVAQLAAEAQDHINRIARSAEQQITQTPDQSFDMNEPIPAVHSIETNPVSHDSPTVTVATVQPVSVPSTTMSQGQPELPSIPAEELSTDVSVQKPDVGNLQRTELLGLLIDRISDGDVSAMDKALVAAALSVVDPSAQPDSDLLKPLNQQQRQRVEQYRQFIVSLGQQVAQATDKMDSEHLVAELNHLFGPPNLQIRNVALCTQVRGYGIYEPIEPRTFVAGRKNKMIVYLEVDNFQVKHNSDGEYEVKLAQQISLFNEANGSLPVWQHPEVKIVDRSRNRRRDFFVVQLINLPALNVGNYRFKIRVTDDYGSYISESTLPVKIIANHALAGR